MAQSQTDKFTFACTMDEFNGIHTCLDSVRTTSMTVKVSKQALTNLLIDHGKLLARYKVEG